MESPACDFAAAAFLVHLMNGVIGTIDPGFSIEALRERGIMGE